MQSAHPAEGASRRRVIQSLAISASLFLIPALPTVVKAAVEPGIFPAEVPHALGTTVIPRRPSRIVAIGWNSEDVAIALGFTPIAIERRTLFKSGMFPWVEERLRGELPVILNGPPFDYEEIAMLKPDLIIAVHSGVDAKEYSIMSRLAPTVVYQSGPWQADWEEQTRIIAQALGQPEASAAFVEDVETYLQATRNSHPELAGLTFTFGVWGAGQSSIGVYMPWEQRVQILTKLGLQVAPGVMALAEHNQHRIWATLSLERVQQIESDILILWFDPLQRDLLAKDPLLNTLSAMKRGALVAIDDPELAWGVSAISILSIRYVYPRLVARLSEAADRARKQSGALHGG